MEEILLRLMLNKRFLDLFLLTAVKEQFFIIFSFMSISREKKAKIIQELEDQIKKQKIMIFFDFSNLDSKSLFNFRKKTKQTNSFLKIVKKSLLEKSFERLDQKEFVERIKKIKTQLGIVFGIEDEIIPAKLCYLFSQENKNFKILGGICNDSFWLTEKIIELAQLPSRNEILTRLVYTLKNPLFNFLNIFQNNFKGLIMILRVISLKNKKI